MAVETHKSTFELEDGRVLSYTTTAVANLPVTAPTVLYFHGYPSSHAEAGLLSLSTIRSNIRLISISRPGFANSTFQDNRTYLSWPRDVLELVKDLRIHQFYILAVSAGSPYALACLQTIPKQQLLGVATVSGVYPKCMTDADKQTWLNRTLAWMTTSTWCLPFMSTAIDLYMGRFSRDDSPEGVARFHEWFSKQLERRGDPKEVQCFQNQDIRRAAIESCREAFRQGSRGVAWEVRLLSSPWDVTTEGLDCSRLDVWLGKLDQNVPYVQAVAATKDWKGCTLHEVEDESHLSLLVNRADDILTSLLSKT